jgi:hypothetical protein
MGICQDHLELVSVGDSVNHVSDDASDGAQDCVSLFLLQPHSEFECGFVGFGALLFGEFEGNMSELFGEGA